MRERVIQLMIQELSLAKDTAEEAAITAEFCVAVLPEEIAHIARACALFHWFDQTVVEALLQWPLTTPAEADQVYKQIQELPFVETLPWGSRFLDLTREGLLQRYTQTQAAWLQQAAKLAISAYEKRQDDKKELQTLSLPNNSLNGSIGFLADDKSNETEDIYTHARLWALPTGS